MPGIHADIAGIRYKYWSSFAPNPAQVLLAAGQRAREETGNMIDLFWFSVFVRHTLLSAFCFYPSFCIYSLFYLLTVSSRD